MTASTTKNSPSFTLTTPSDLEIVMTRTFDAPRHLVFEAWTKPEHVARWWGPDKYTISMDEWDLRPGGKWKITHSADGRAITFSGEFREVVTVGAVGTAVKAGEARSA